MKKNWLTIGALITLGAATILTSAGIAIVNRLDYEVMSYQVQVLDNEGITFRVMIGVINPSLVDIDIWNQKYDVFVAGYKMLEINSKQTYRIMAGSTSAIPLDISLRWTDIYNNALPIGSTAQYTSLPNLPIVIRGTLAARIGIFRVMRLPVRMAVPLSYFLP